MIVRLGMRPALISALVAAVAAPKLNAQYRERREAKRAAREAVAG